MAMSRRHLVWNLKQRQLLTGERTLIMGVLNVTPDSFSDGGRFLDPDRAFARAIDLEEQGVDIIDVGAESTRPGAQRISEAEEMRRLIPVLKRLHGKLTVPISVDTYKSTVAEKALEYGAEIINDPSGLTFDPHLARAVANHDGGLIINHMRGTPESWEKLPPLKDVMGAIRQDLDASVHRAVGAGMNRARIAIDPGLGFGKRKEQNSEILARLGELAGLELLIVSWASRKGFLGHGLSDAALQCAAAAALTAAILASAHMLPVHHVAVMQTSAQLADQILNSVGTSDSSVSHALLRRSAGPASRK